MYRKHPSFRPRGMWFFRSCKGRKRSRPSQSLNCDHIAMQKLHACLIREGTCVESPCCDYCIVGDRHPMAQKYQLVKKKNGLMVSVKKEEEN